VIELIVVSSLTAVACGIGAIPVFALGPERVIRWRAGMVGLAAGVMSVAAVIGLLIPGFDEGPAIEVIAGAAIGVVLLFGLRGWLRHRGELSIGGGSTTSVLVFVVLFAHSLPEGFAIGTAYASSTAGLGLFVVIAIAIQNIPEGTSVAIPLSVDGRTPWEQFWAAVLSSVPQPVGAVVAYLFVERVESLLSLSFGFAAGAMLALVVRQLAPDAIREDHRRGLVGIALGALLMGMLSIVLSV
jgi:zinc transporter, ZIP family